MRAYYNDNEPFVCDWLSNLMDAGLVTPGRIDDRDIAEVTPDDVEGYERVHLCAGIGGWDLALTWAGWGERPAWTASFPCQPFSAAGQQRGTDDDRHIWPVGFRLISECRPLHVFGEQVPGAIRLGWIDAVFDDMEGAGYTCGAIILGAHSAGAPHIRERLWWVADAPGGETISATAGRFQPGAGDNGAPGGMAVTTSQQRRAGTGGKDGPETVNGSRLAVTDGRDACAERQQRGREHPQWQQGGGVEFIPCADGKARATQPGLHPLAHGVSGRLGKLRGFGNAICPQVATEFIRAYMEIKK